MKSFFAVLTIYAYLALLQLAPTIPVQKLIAAEQSLHAAMEAPQ